MSRGHKKLLGKFFIRYLYDICNSYSLHYQVKLILFHHETLVLQFHGYINLIMNYTLIKMIQFWFIDKKLNPPLSTFLLRLTLPKTSHFLPCILYIGNIKELFHDTAVLMVFMGSTFPGVRKILLVVELHIFCSSKKYLI